MADVDLPPGVDATPVETSAVVEEQLDAEPISDVFGSELTSQSDRQDEGQPKKKNLFNNEYDLDEDNPLAGSDSEDDEIQVTIGKIEPINVQFSLKNSTYAERTHASKLDIDAVPTINDQPIYDVDLASMEDRPWRKPGADITDYFNYGFTEETWNTYCERQKKLRTEFTSQAAVNKALFSNIYLANPLGMPAVSNRVTGVSDSPSTVKVLTDNGGRFKVHHHNRDEPFMRTVIGAPSASHHAPPGVTTPNAAPPPAMDFSRPPPGMGMPSHTIPTVLGGPPVAEVPPPVADAPPGVGPPGVDGPPGIEMGGQSTIPTVGSANTLDMSMPIFNPSLPPPGMPRPPPIGLPPVTIGPPGFNTMLPPPGYNQARYPMNSGPQMQRPPPLMGREFDVRRDSGDMDDERRRRRSRSRSPRRNDRDVRRRDERDDRRDRRDKERERERGDRSRRHRSKSREDRDKRRERRDDDDRKRSSRRERDEDDDRKDRRERRKKDEKDRSPDKESNDEDAVEQ